MRRVGALDVVAGMGVGDHACWGYDDPAGYHQQVLLYLAEGGEAGDRLWYVGDKPGDALMADLRPLARRDELLAGGQLRVSQARDVYGRVGAFDAEAVLDRFRVEAARALADGYRGLRVATDVTALATEHGTRRRMIGHELASDRLITAGPLIVLCGYAQHRIAADFPAIAAVHPLQHGTTPPVPFSLHWDHAGLRLTGEVDYATTGALRAVLHAAVAVTAGPLVIDLSDLGFIDVGGTRVLARALLAADLDGRPVRLRAPRPTVLRCLDLFDLAHRVQPCPRHPPIEPP